TRCPLSVVRRAPCRITANTSRANARAAARSPARAYAATAPNHAPGSALAGNPSSRCARASNAAPPATFAAGSRRNRARDNPVSSAASGNVRNRSGTRPAGAPVVADTESADPEAAARPGHGRRASPRGSSAPW
ncbi:hypothetical protein HOY81_26865, partial [Streptomyces sp. JJ36]|nr:hypothetical protein [Streptomyces sp. JJ36]